MENPSIRCCTNIDNFECGACDIFQVLRGTLEITPKKFKILVLFGNWKNSFQIFGLYDNFILDRLDVNRFHPMGNLIAFDTIKALYVFASIIVCFSFEIL